MKECINIQNIIIIYYGAINSMGWFLMARDKRKSRKNQWRIPEKTFFTLAFLGGGLGIIAGMKINRHKTLHLSFRWGIPFIMVLHIILLFLILNGLGIK